LVGHIGVIIAGQGIRWQPHTYHNGAVVNRVPGGGATFSFMNAVIGFVFTSASYSLTREHSVDGFIAADERPAMGGAEGGVRWTDG